VASRGGAASANTGGFRHRIFGVGNGRHSHSHSLDLDVGARLIGVDLQEHVADTQSCAFVMGDDVVKVFLNVKRTNSTSRTSLI
jgi:hypothetical protein